jgi:hypothetical protein
MFNKKSKLAAKITVFILITALFLWLLPAELMFGDTEQFSSTGSVGEATITLRKTGLPSTITPVMSVTGPGGYNGTLAWTWNSGANRWDSNTLTGLLPGVYTVAETVADGYPNPVFNIVSGATLIGELGNSMSFSVAADGGAIISVGSVGEATITLRQILKILLKKINIKNIIFWLKLIYLQLY